MKQILFVVAFMLALKSYTQKELYFATDPVLTPDASQIVFAYDSDLWKVPVEGGEAYRLTAMEGQESKPAISPDGKWLAFTSNRNGNNDVFLMPLKGGDIQQLTYHEANDEVETWGWDSKEIYFSSDRYSRMATYTVSVNGGTPKRILEHFFNTVHDVVLHPSTGEIFFNETWESSRFTNRKRYIGSYNPDIQSYNPKTEQLKKYTTYQGKDFGTTIDQNGHIYFMSAENKGEYNLYTFENGKKTPLTDFNTSVYFPKVSADGSKIVYRRDYQIYVYDVKKKSVSKPSITITDTRFLNDAHRFNVKNKIQSFDISPNEKMIAFSSRGKLFVSDSKGKLVKEIPTDNREAVGEVKWLADNKTLIYAQTVKGYYNWFIQSVNEKSSVKQLTSDKQMNRNISFNSDKTQAVYLSGKNEVRLMNLKTFTSETVVKDELWGFYNSQPYFSPDDQYVLFTAYKNFEKEIKWYNLTTKKVENLTRTLVSENDPFWSPDGKYIYFSSDRKNPSYPFGTTEQHIYRLPLAKYDEALKTEKINEMLAEKTEDPKDSVAKNNKKDTKKGVEKTEKETPKVTVEAKDIETAMDRLELVSNRFGEQGSPFVSQSDGKTYVLYLSNHQGGENQLWKTVYEDFEKPKTELVNAKTVNNSTIEQVGKQIYGLINGSLYTINAEKNSLDEIAIEYGFEKSLEDEFNQMFYETWATVEQNFYDENFHGENWEKRKEQYEKLLPYLNNRADLRMLLNDLLGELNTSHYGFYTGGEDERTDFTKRTSATGIVFFDDKPFEVKGIVTDSPADVSRLDIQQGDKLIAVNGVTVSESENRESYFTFNTRKEELTLQFERKGKPFEVTLHPVSYGSVLDLLYDEWQKQNEQYVNQKSNNTIAYVHMKNMGGDELESFLEKMVREDSQKEGLIVDLRFNTGGNVHDAVLQFLSQRPYLQWKYREGALTIQPNFAPSAHPIVMLINQQSLSDAEMASAGFKELGLGTLVGTETYRWIIFTTAGRLVDNSVFRLPSWGCYTLDGKNLEKTGVAPDVEVDETLIDRLKGKQPQLDKAVEVILKNRK